MTTELYVWRRGNSWVKVEPEGTARIGVLHDVVKRYAKISSLRIVVEEGAKVKQGDKIAMILVGKATITIESPVSGTIVKINASVRTDPDIVRKDPTGEGWLAIIKPSNLDEDLKNLIKG